MKGQVGLKKVNAKDLGLSKQAQDFLLFLFQESESGRKECAVSDIAAKLNVSKPAVSRMGRFLAHKGFVKRARYSLISLLPKGTRLASEIVKKRRIVEVFLNSRLGLKLRDAEAEAHLLEHSVSSHTIKKLYEFLGKPKLCPHGRKIK